MKTHVITLAKTFPKGHPKAGEETDFQKKVIYAIMFNRADAEAKEIKALKSFCCSTLADEFCDDSSVSEFYIPDKIHTIRTNMPLWQRRIKEVEAGEACLSIRMWTGRPYLSKQMEIVRLTKEDGVGIQQLDGYDVKAKNKVCKVYDTQGVKPVYAKKLARKDGLSLEDWRAWFKGCTDDSLAIIHFTHFRY